MNEKETVMDILNGMDPLERELVLSYIEGLEEKANVLEDTGCTEEFQPKCAYFKKGLDLEEKVKELDKEIEIYRYTIHTEICSSKYVDDVKCAHEDCYWDQCTGGCIMKRAKTPPKEPETNKEETIPWKRSKEGRVCPSCNEYSYFWMHEDKPICIRCGTKEPDKDKEEEEQ